MASRTEWHLSWVLRCGKKPATHEAFWAKRRARTRPQGGKTERMPLWGPPAKRGWSWGTEGWDSAQRLTTEHKKRGCHSECSGKPAMGSLQRLIDPIYVFKDVWRRGEYLWGLGLGEDYWDMTPQALYATWKNDRPNFNKIKIFRSVKS